MSDGPRPPADAPPRCRCGYDRDHLMVSADLEYSVWGWFWLTLIGASAKPIRAVWRCRVCQEILDETDDPDALQVLRER